MEQRMTINRTTVSLLFLVGALVAVACSQSSGTGGDDDGGTDTDTDTDVECGWEVEVPQDSGLFDFLKDAWGSAPDDVYAVGQDDAIAHFNGVEWQAVDAPASSTEYPYAYMAVWGADSDDVFAVGTVWVDSPTGIAVHFDGVEWTEMEVPEAVLLHSVWGSSGSDVYAVGPGWDAQSLPYSGARALHYDGDVWTEVVELDIDPYEMAYHDVWGSGPDDVFVVGEMPNHVARVFHFDGSDWSEMLTDPDWRYPFRIEGTSSNSVYLTMDRPECLAHFDGELWGPAVLCEGVESDGGDLDPWLLDLWNPEPGKVFMLDGDMTVWSWIDGEWTLELYDPEGLGARTVWGFSVTNYYAIGALIWHYSCQ